MVATLREDNRSSKSTDPLRQHAGHAFTMYGIPKSTLELTNGLRKPPWSTGIIFRHFATVVGTKYPMITCSTPCCLPMLVTTHVFSVGRDISDFTILRYIFGSLDDDVIEASFLTPTSAFPPEQDTYGVTYARTPRCPRRTSNRSTKAYICTAPLYIIHCLNWSAT